MPIRKSDADWQGNLREGRGDMRFGGGAFEGTFSYSSRFEEGTGTNPEELIGAAHAGCFSMQLSGGLSRAGFTPKRIHTEAQVHLDKVGDGFKITRIDLLTDADVPGISDEQFQQAAEAAKEGCPVSRALAAIEITLQARLASS